MEGDERIRKEGRFEMVTGDGKCLITSRIREACAGITQKSQTPYTLG